MTVEDFSGASEVNNEIELEAVLKKRYEHDANSFWLSHGSKEDPAIAILVKGNFASLNYFPKGESAGFRSVGNVEGLEPGEMSIFYLDSPRQKQEVLNDSIVPFSQALEVAKEFLVSEDLPSFIEWFEL